jgi:hypothetical protein
LYEECVLYYLYYILLGCTENILAYESAFSNEPARALVIVNTKEQVSSYLPEAAIICVLRTL